MLKALLANLLPQRVKEAFQSTDSRNGLASEQSGQIVMGIILVIAAVFGLGFMAMIDWSFIVVIMVFAVIAIASVGAVLNKNITLWHVLSLAVVCLAIVVVIEVGVLPAAGLALLGMIFYKFDVLQGQNIWIWVSLVGVGMLAVIIGSWTAQIMGVFP